MLATARISSQTTTRTEPLELTCQLFQTMATSAGKDMQTMAFPTVRTGVARRLFSSETLAPWGIGPFRLNHRGKSREILSALFGASGPILDPMYSVLQSRSIMDQTPT